MTPRSSLRVLATRRAATARWGSGAVEGVDGLWLRCHDRSDGGAPDQRAAGAAIGGGSSSARSATTTSAPASTQGVRADATVDADDDPEAAAGAGGDAGDGVLDHDAPFRLDAEQLGGIPEGVRLRLAGEPLLGRDGAVDEDVEPFGQARRLRTCGPLREEVTTAARSAAALELVEQRDRPGIGLDPLGVEDLVEQRRSCGCPGRRWSPRLASRRASLAAGRCPGAQERCDALVARLSVDVVEVVLVGVGRAVGRTSSGSRSRTLVKSCSQARMCTSAVGVSTPSRSKRTAPAFCHSICPTVGQDAGRSAPGSGTEAPSIAVVDEGLLGQASDLVAPTPALGDHRPHLLELAEAQQPVLGLEHGAGDAGSGSRRCRGAG